MKYKIILVTILISCSCNQEKNNNKRIEVEIIKKDTTLSEKEICKILSDSDIIDLSYVKEHFKDCYTSGISSHKERSNLYFKMDDDYFLGQYNFPYNGEDKKACWMSAQLMIYNNEKPWNYENNTDIFVEITVNNPGIFLFGQIEVTSSLDNVKSKLGEPYREYKDVFIYKFESQNLVVILKIQNNQVICFRAGRYNNEALLNIKSYLPLLLDEMGECE